MIRINDRIWAMGSLLLLIGVLLKAGESDLPSQDVKSPTLQAAPAYRVDGGDERQPWYELTDGKFPPPGAAHEIAGELISNDHINRNVILRPDRSDQQRRGDWDLALPITLLPYCTVMYHGAYAELKDIPLGTHLRGEFFVTDAATRRTHSQRTLFGKRTAVLDGEFSFAIRLEDDFSYALRRGRMWKVTANQTSTRQVTVIEVGREKPGSSPSKPLTFTVLRSAKIWRGDQLVSLEEVKVGVEILFNLTAATLRGAGRLTEIWTDQESRRIASELQFHKHCDDIELHGFPGWIDEVDHQRREVVVTLFDTVDPTLLNAFDSETSVHSAVADASMRTWDQVNDKKSGPIRKLWKSSASPGDSGVRIRFSPVTLLEGHRPGHHLRIFPGSWAVLDPPREEKRYY